ncbi:MAG: hypothetical protein QM783_20230 [Phycisphaerales bacterium]
MSLSLPQLRVDSPCPMSWDAMRGDHRSRFCDHCQLHVHNVSALTKREARALLAASSGRLCLNGYVRPDGELVTQDELADLLESHGAAPERVAAVRAAVSAGLAVAALSLAACSSPVVMGGAVAVPEEHVQPSEQQVQPPRTGGIAPTVSPDAVRYPTMTGGAPPHPPTPPQMEWDRPFPDQPR